MRAQAATPGDVEEGGGLSEGENQLGSLDLLLF